MAISKRTRQASAEPPSVVPFLRVLDEGAADPVTVAKAYQHVLAEWSDAGGGADVEIVAERPEPDPSTPAARMVRLMRETQWKSFNEGDQ